MPREPGSAAITISKLGLLGNARTPQRPRKPGFPSTDRTLGDVRRNTRKAALHIV